MKSCAIFIHQSTLKLTEPSVDISQNLLSAITTNTLPPTLVVCLPQVQITSSGMKPTSCLQEIPVSTVDGSLVGKESKAKILGYTFMLLEYIGQLFCCTCVLCCVLGPAAASSVVLGFPYHLLKTHGCP